MVSRKSIQEVEDEIMPESLDEGWWAAVLADEDAIMPAQKEIIAKPNHQPAVTVIDWTMVQQVYEQDEIIQLKVHGFNRGGLLVQGDGIQGFVPVSHLVEMPNSANDDERRSVLAGYVDRLLNLKVIECEPSQERIVLSERAALAGEGQRRALFDTLKEGAILTGRVTNVTDFGVFIDLGGVEGLIHVSELSWGRVQHPTEVLAIDDTISVLVLQVCEETSRIALSLKRLNPNPWETLSVRYKIGDVVPAKITSITRFGAFARLEEGVEGLIHVSSINIPGGRGHIEDVLYVGQPVQTRIIHIDIDRRRLGLGLVQAE